MTEEQAEKLAQRSSKKAAVYRCGSNWDAPWDWVKKGSAKWKKLRAGEILYDKRTFREV